MSSEGRVLICTSCNEPRDEALDFYRNDQGRILKPCKLCRIAQLQKKRVGDIAGNLAGKAAYINDRPMHIRHVALYNYVRKGQITSEEFRTLLAMVKISSPKGFKS